MDSYERFAGIVTILTLAVVLAWGGVQMVTESQCLAAGYPSAKVSWAFDRYCIKRVDQTDVVVPFAQR